jgi:hypothetical protein
MARCDENTSAADNLADRVDLTWSTVAGFSAYRVERLSAPPGPPGMGPAHMDWSRIFSANDPTSTTDVFVLPGLEYHYKYYGLAESGNQVLLGEDIGKAAGGMPPPPPANTIRAGAITALQQGLIAIADLQQHHDKFTWDTGTLWLLGNGKSGSPADFHLGDPVKVLFIKDGVDMYAMQVTKDMPH